MSECEVCFEEPGELGLERIMIAHWDDDPDQGLVPSIHNYRMCFKCANKAELRNDYLPDHDAAERHLRSKPYGYL